MKYYMHSSAGNDHIANHHWLQHLLRMIVHVAGYTFIGHHVHLNDCTGDAGACHAATMVHGAGCTSSHHNMHMPDLNDEF